MIPTLRRPAEHNQDDVRPAPSRPAAVTITVVLAAFTAVGACTSEVAPTPPSISSGTSTTSANGTPESSGSPEATKGEAEAFAKKFLEVSGDAALRADPSTYKTLYTSDCAPCVAYTEKVEQAAARGEHVNINPYGYELRSAERRPDGDWTVKSLALVRHSFVVDSSGKKVEEWPADRYLRILRLRPPRDGEGWKVVGSVIADP